MAHFAKVAVRRVKACTVAASWKRNKNKNKGRAAGKLSQVWGPQWWVCCGEQQGTSQQRRGVAQSQILLVKLKGMDGLGLGPTGMPGGLRRSRPWTVYSPPVASRGVQRPDVLLQ
jgi:hypothetical protein